MQLTYPDPGGEDAAEGDAAHWVCTQAFGGAMPNEGAAAPNGRIVTSEMVDGATLWLQTIGQPAEHHYVEHRLPGSARVHPQLNWGTPDYWDIGSTAKGTLLRVIDYKYGHGYVDARENWQLVCYAALACDYAGISGLTDHRVHVELTIVQPRNYHRDGPVRTWSPGTAADLRGYVNILRAAAERAASPDPQATPGEHCRYCSGRHACEPLQRAAGHIADVAGSPMLVEPTARMLGRELRSLNRAAQLLDARRSALEEQAIARIRRGESIPHYALGQTRGREQWTLPADAVIAFGAAAEVDVSKPAVLTPAQARKAGMPADLVSAMSERAPGGLKLVDADDSAARAFTPTTTTTQEP